MDPAAARQGLLKLVPVKKSNEGGGPANQAQAKAWRARRRNEGGHVHLSNVHNRPSTSDGTTRPVHGLPEKGFSQGEPQSATPALLSQWKRNSKELFHVWGEDPQRIRVNPVFNRRRDTKTAGRPNTADDLLRAHSRHLFRPVNDKCREVGTLPLRERLFLFYKRFARKMLESVSEIAEYWKEDEPTLENLLSEKYGSTLDEEGFGRASTELIQIPELQSQMQECRVEMSEDFRPREEWIPQHARSISPLAMRDALLLSEAQACAPVWEVDETARAMFMHHETAPGSPGSSQPETSRPETPSNKFGVLHKVALSLKEQVVTWQPTSNEAVSTSRARTPAFTMSAEQSRLPTPLQIHLRPELPMSASSVREEGKEPAPEQRKSTGGLPPPRTANVDAAKDNWREMQSTTHGQPYWYNTFTGESRWLPPVSTNILSIDSGPATSQTVIRGASPQPEPHDNADDAAPEVLTIDDDEEQDAEQRALPAGVGQADAVEEQPAMWSELETAASDITEDLVALSAGVEAETTAAADNGAGNKRRGMLLHHNFSPSKLAHQAAPPGQHAKLRADRRSAERVALDSAAVRIQARARGWLARRERREGAERVRRALLGVMANRIQGWWRGWLHHQAARARRAKLKASGFTVYMAKRGLVQGGRMWLSRARGRLEEERRLAAAIRIQKHFRGMVGVRAFRRQRQDDLARAAGRVQRAWRRQKEWQALAAGEEQRAVEEAGRLRRQYLFAGKNAKQAKAFRGSAEDRFDAATTELGRSKAEAKLAAAHGREGAEVSSFGVWMATLRALMRAEGTDQAAAASPGRAASAAGSEERAGGMAEILAFSKLTNPPDVDNAIGEQRHEYGRKLTLNGMLLQRWPFGVSDKSKGGQPWWSLRTVWLSNNLLQGLPLDFFVLSSLTDLRLDRNRIQTLSPALANLSALTSIWLHSNHLQALPPDIGRLTKLTFISLYDNRLTSLPFEVCLLRGLRKLPMYGNPECKSPPQELVERTRTTEGLVEVMHFTGRFLAAFSPPHTLDLAAFGLSYIPQIERVPAAQTIDMSGNLLADIPDGPFFDFKFNVAVHHQLTSLSLARNQLSVFPLATVRLATLRHLDLRDNAIDSVPVDVVGLRRLVELRMEGNPLVSPSFSTLADGVETYRLSGARSHPAADGLYYRSDADHDGAHVYEQRTTSARQPVPAAERLLLYYCAAGSRQGWCVGASLSPDAALLTVNDQAARPAAVRSTWREVAGSGALFRSSGVEVRGLGLTEYLARVMALGESKARLRQMEEQHKVSAMLYASSAGRADTADAVARRRTLHEAIESSRRAIALDMSHLALSSFPPHIADGAVQHLNLDHNHLDDVSPAVVEMPLASLSFRFNALAAIPKSLRRLTALQSLSLQRNCLATLPDQLSRLLLLRTLLVSANLLQTVPAAVPHMTRLQLLDLAHNSLRALPSSLSSLLDMQELRLGMNLLEHLHGVDDDHPSHDPHLRAESPLARMLSLHTLDMDANRLTAIPKSLRTLTRLVTVSFGRNRMEDIGDVAATLSGWASVRTLSLQHNSLVTMPKRLRGPLPALSRLDLAANGLSALPPCLASLPGLAWLSLTDNFLKHLPSEIGALSRLQHLDVSHNLLASLAVDLRLCTCLRSLSLAHNKLVRLPPHMGHALVVLGRLVQLESLDVSGNQLLTLPTDLLQCSALSSLKAAGNAFTHSAIQRALLPHPPVGLVRVTVHEAAEIRPASRSARAATCCVVSAHRTAAAQDGEEGTEQGGWRVEEAYGEEQETTAKGATDSPVWGETLWVAVSRLSDGLVLRMCHRRGQGRAELGYRVEVPAAYPLLDSVPLLHALGDSALARMAESTREVRLEAGQELAQQGGCLQGMVLVVRGRLTVLQRTHDGAEREVGELRAGGTAGACCLVEGRGLQHSLQAAAPCLLLLLPHAALSPILAGDPELLIPLVLGIQQDERQAAAPTETPEAVTGAGPGPAKQAAAWGSKEWERERAEELSAVAGAVRAGCRFHRLEATAERKAVAVLEQRAKTKTDAGGSVADCRPSAPLPPAQRQHTLRLASTVKDKYGAHPPTVLVTLSFQAADSTTPHLQALRQIEREGGDKTATQSKPVAAAQVRRTPSGLSFETDQDEARGEEEVRRVEGDMAELQTYKQSLRAQRVWEAAPRMLVIPGAFPSEIWNGSNDRNRHQSTNAFADMSRVAAALHSDKHRPPLDPRPPLSELPSSSCTARGVWQRVEEELEALRKPRSALGDGTAGGGTTEAARRRVCGTAVEGWGRVAGLLVSRPEWVLRKEEGREALGVQDLHLATLRDQQEVAGYREKARWLKRRMQRTLNDMEGVRARVRAAERELAGGWSGEAMAARKAAGEELALMQGRFDRQRRDKDAVKTTLALREASGAALQWRGDGAVSGVLSTLQAQRSALLDPVGALGNPQGGEVEADMLAALARAEHQTAAQKMTPAEVQAWARGDAVLGQSERVRGAVAGVLARYEVGGRLLLHLGKDDLLRMGLLGPDARAALVALAALKRRLGEGTARSRAEGREFRLSAEVARLEPDVAAIRELLGRELELEPKQVEGLRKAFMRHDRDRRGEITWAEALHAAASVGMSGSERRVGQLKMSVEPSEATSLDLVGFCKLGKALLSSAQLLN